jgi:DNA-binding NarL/FixJ family response regulator
VTTRVIGQFAQLRRREPPAALDELTDRERDVFRLVAQGMSNAEIGRTLYISETTVKTHVTRVLAKIDFRDRVQAVVLAHRGGLFDGEDG